MNIVIYARYSSHSQAEQSIEGQLQTCYEFAKNNGHIVIDEYIFEGVFVYQLDRFARNRYDSAIRWQRSAVAGLILGLA